MKQLPILLFALIFLACNGSDGTKEIDHAANSEEEGPRLDTFNFGEFGSSFSMHRDDWMPRGYIQNIKSEVVYRDNFYMIVNYIEIYEEGYFEYALELNPARVNDLEEEFTADMKSVIDCLQQDTIPFNFYKGHLNKRGDFNRDQNSDYIMSYSDITMKRTIEEQTIYFFMDDGLLHSGISAKSDYTSGEGGFIGLGESLTWQGNQTNLVETYVRETFLAPVDRLDFAEVCFTKHYDLGKESYFQIIDNLYYLEENHVDQLPIELYYINTEGEEWKLKQDCQNGGLDMLGFVKSTQGDRTYLVQSGNDNINMEFIAGINQIDSLNYLLYIGTIEQNDHDLSRFVWEGEYQTLLLNQSMDDPRLWNLKWDDQDWIKATSYGSAFAMETCL